MTVHKGGTDGSCSRGGRASIVLLIWVLLILAQLGFFYVVHEETGKLMVMKSFLPRKARFLETQSLFHPPPLSKVQSSMNSDKRDPHSSVYEDDKRIIHTGPNPLHN